MRVAIVGGTGPFGRALATRLREGGIEAVIGSRDAQRAAEVASELGVEGAANSDAVDGVDLVVLATKADAALDTARALKDDIGTTPVLSVASELRFADGKCLPCRSQMSLAEQLQSDLKEVGIRITSANNIVRGVAIANFLPRIGLTTLYGGQSSELENVVKQLKLDPGPFPRNG